MWGLAKFIHTGNTLLSIGVTIACLLIIIVTAIIMNRKAEAENQPATAPIRPKPVLNAAQSARAEAAKHLRQINIQNLISPIEDRWRAVMGDKDIIFTVFCDPRIIQPLVINPDALNHIIHSLMGRAVYTTSSGRIHMHITEKQNPDAPDTPHLELIIADTGSGLIASKATSLEGEEYDFKTEDIKPHIKTTSGRLVHKSRLGRGAEFIFTCPFINENIAFSERLMAPPLGKMKQIKLEDYYAQHVDDVKAQLETRTLYPSQLPSNPAGGNPPSISLSSHRAATIEADIILSTLSGLSALIVEDNESNRQAIRALLAPLNPEIIYAPTGQDAINALKTYIFDYIIMDIHMPGMSGIETAKIIREQELELGRFNIPIIGLSADSTPENIDNALAAGIDIMLAKPVTSRTLFDGIYKSREAHPRYKNHAETTRKKRQA